MLKLKMADAEKVKKSFIASILKGESQEKISRKAKAFFDEYYPNIFRDNALDFIKNMKSENTESYIVTASLDIWVQAFAEKFQMKLIATEAKFEKGIYTGHFKTKNCNGQEKVNRIKKAIEGEKFDKTIAFGDTDGDREMLAWANEGYFQFFH
jgi:HAD superfamily phosphoserine phosphatase-like hydrolase